MGAIKGVRESLGIQERQLKQKGPNFTGGGWGIRGEKTLRLAPFL